jgi:tetratricopeptide (TPR) repeat protein
MSQWSDGLDGEQGAALLQRLRATGDLDERRQILKQLENAVGDLRLRMITEPEEAGKQCRQLLEQLRASDELPAAPLDQKWQRRRDALEMSLTNYLAQTLVEAGDWDGAAATYERCLELGTLFQVPEFQADSLLKLGKAYRHAGNLVQARQSFERAGALAQHNGLFMLEVDALYEQAVVDELENRTASAFEHYQAGLKLSREQRLHNLSVRFLSQLGQLYHSQGDYPQALANYRECLQLLRDTDNDQESEVIILGQISHICAETRAFKEGIAAAEEGLNLSRQTGQQSEEETFLSDLARLLGRQARYEEALTYAGEARHLAEVRGNTASLRIAEQLIAKIKQQQQLHPFDPASTAAFMTTTDPDLRGVAVYYQRGNRYYHRGTFEQAISAYSRAINLDPNYVLAYINRGSAYTARGHYDRALADYTRAIELDPNDAVVYFNRGNAYRKRREYEKALSDYTQAIKLDPNDPDAYFNRGEVLRRMGRRDEAAADFRRVIALSIGHDEAGADQARKLLAEMKFSV